MCDWPPGGDTKEALEFSVKNREEVPKNTAHDKFAAGAPRGALPPVRPPREGHAGVARLIPPRRRRNPAPFSPRTLFSPRRDQASPRGAGRAPARGERRRRDGQGAPPPGRHDAAAVDAGRQPEAHGDHADGQGRGKPGGARARGVRAAWRCGGPPGGPLACAPAPRFALRVTLALLSSSRALARALGGQSSECPDRRCRRCRRDPSPGTPPSGTCGCASRWSGTSRG